jgi:hypothetical protein
MSREEGSKSTVVKEVSRIFERRRCSRDSTSALVSWRFFGDFLKGSWKGYRL